jgi:hypothetical protein
MILAITSSETVFLAYYDRQNKLVIENFWGVRFGWCIVFPPVLCTTLEDMRKWHKRWGDEILHDDGDD